MLASGPSEPVEPEVAVMPVKTPEPVITPPEVPSSTNTKIVIIEDDDGSDPGPPPSNPLLMKTTETEPATIDQVDPEPTQDESEVAEDP